LVTVTSGGSSSAGNLRVFRQMIEGFNVADLGWGTANAQTITVSFWVRSNVTGTFACYVSNAPSFNRSQVQTYTISSANTWEYKSVVFSGDTSGTWGTDNGIGLELGFDIGSGSDFNATAGVWNAAYDTRTSGAVTLSSTTNNNIQITGVQLEKGSTATSFDYRPYGTELALCQRYCFNVSSASGVPIAFFSAVSSSDGWSFIPFPVTPRVPPTGIVSVTSTWIMNSFGSGNTGNRALTFSSASPSGVTVQATGASTFVGGITGQLYSNGAAGQFYTTGSEL
jgi:hypothetical protein